MWTGAAIMPGAGLLEIALGAARGEFPDAPSLEVSGFEIPRAMTLEADGGREMIVSRDRDNAIEIKSRPRLSDEAWSIHAVGRIAAGSRLATTMEESHIPLRSSAASRIIGGEEIYAAARAIGLDYGPLFQTVTEVRIVDGGVADVFLSPPAGAGEAGFVLHPAFARWRDAGDYRIDRRARGTGAGRRIPAIALRARPRVRSVRSPAVIRAGQARPDRRPFGAGLDRTVRRSGLPDRRDRRLLVPACAAIAAGYACQQDFSL